MRFCISERSGSAPWDKMSRSIAGINNILQCPRRKHICIAITFVFESRASKNVIYVGTLCPVQSPGNSSGLICVVLVKLSHPLPEGQNPFTRPNVAFNDVWELNGQFVRSVENVSTVHLLERRRRRLRLRRTSDYHLAIFRGTIDSQALELFKTIHLNDTFPRKKDCFPAQYGPGCV